MIEIPEANTFARQLQESFMGKTITQVHAAHSPHGFAWYNGDPALYQSLLAGKQFTGAKANGGQVELFIEDMRIVLNDGVNIRYFEPGAPLPPKYQMYVGFSDDSGFVCRVQMYGGMMAFKENSYDNPYYLAALQKPNPLAEEFDEAYFHSIVAKTDPKLSAKALLATEQRIPGLGNGCLHDILYCAGVNPQTKLRMLQEQDVHSMFYSVKSVLREMSNAGGRDTEKDLYGNPGGYYTVLSSKTAAYACRHCGGGITRKAYMGGNVYFCASCQPLHK